MGTTSNNTGSDSKQMSELTTMSRHMSKLVNIMKSIKDDMEESDKIIMANYKLLNNIHEQNEIIIAILEDQEELDESIMNMLEKTSENGSNPLGGLLGFAISSQQKNNSDNPDHPLQNEQTEQYEQSEQHLQDARENLFSEEMEFDELFLEEFEEEEEEEEKQDKQDEQHSNPLAGLSGNAVKERK